MNSIYPWSSSIFAAAIRLSASRTKLEAEMLSNFLSLWKVRGPRIVCVAAMMMDLLKWSNGVGGRRWSWVARWAWTLDSVQAKLSLRIVKFQIIYCGKFTSSEFLTLDTNFIE